MTTVLARLRTEEDGSAYAAVEMVLVVAFILLPLLAGLAQIPRWVDAKATADLAAQEAARTMVLADSIDDGVAAAQMVVETIVENRGMDVGVLRDVRIEGALVRGGTITVTIVLEVPPVAMPGMGPIGGTISLSRSASERVDDYREITG